MGQSLVERKRLKVTEGACILYRKKADELGENK